MKIESKEGLASMEGTKVEDENLANSGTTNLLSLTLFLTRLASVVENTLKVFFFLDSSHKTHDRTQKIHKLPLKLYECVTYITHLCNLECILRFIMLNIIYYVVTN